MKLKVKVHPRARVERVIKGEVWEVWVKEPPEKGRANRRLLEILSQELGVSKGKIKILTGHGGRIKFLEVKND